MEKKKIASLEIRNNKLYVPAVLSFLDSIISNHTKVDFERYNRLRFIFGEILKYRIEKAYPSSEGILWIELYIKENFFEISIKDLGTPGWYDFSYSKDSLSNNKDLTNYILELWTDGVGIEKLGKEGQRIYIRQRIKNPIHFNPPETYPDTEALDTNITIRPVATEKDAIEAIRCIYSEYGYSYSYEQLYYVDSLLCMIKNNELISFLAVNQHGQTAGHFALAFSELYKNMPEISSVVIRKEFRGLGLFSKFIDYCIDMGKKQGFRALMGQPVAFHPMSQKAFLRAGFTATSLLMSYINSDIESEYNKDEQRLDLCSSVKILDTTAQSIIYPPKELTSFIGKIYNRLEWQYEFRENSKVSDLTEISIENNGTLRMKRIILRHSSEDLEQILKETVTDSIRKKNEMVELFISLNSPSCEHGYQTAKKCHFILSGIIPGGETNDYLVMQILLNTKRHYEHLITVGEFDELKNDIISITDYNNEEADYEL